MRQPARVTIRNADFQSAVSPISNRRATACSKTWKGRDGLQVKNLRNSRLKIRVTSWLFLLFAVAVAPNARLIAAAASPSKAAPASVSKIEGTDLKRVSLLSEAATRLDLKTTPVREETIEPRQRVAGEVAKVSTDGNSATICVDLTESELRKVLREAPAFVLPLARESKESRLKAAPLSGVIA